MAFERARSSAVSVVLVLCFATSLVVFDEPPAAAQAPGALSFACRASAVNLLGVEPGVANAGHLPCADDARANLGVPVAGLGLQAVSATTHLVSGGGGAASRAQLVGLDLAPLALRADLVDAEAAVTCQGDQPLLTGTSKVVGLTVNGRPVSSGDAVSLPLGVATIHLNHTVSQGGTLVQRAVSLETLFGTVVLGEAQVGHTGNPCAAAGTITIIKVARPNAETDFPFTGDLGPFSLRDDDRTVGADRRAFPRPAGSYRVTELESTGGIFADDWFLQDLECVDPDGGTTADRANKSAQVDLDPGENVVCTFTNLNPPALALPGGFDDPTRGLDPVPAKFDPDAPMPPSRAGVEIPLPPTTTAGTVPDDGTDGRDGADGTDGAGGSGASLVSAGAALVAVPVIALVAGAIWFLLAAGRRRRDEAA